MVDLALGMLLYHLSTIAGGPQHSGYALGCVWVRSVRPVVQIAPISRGQNRLGSLFLGPYYAVPDKLIFMVWVDVVSASMDMCF